MSLRYNRIVLKISGESLASELTGEHLDHDRVTATVKHLAELHQLGVSIAAVVGGGNFFRGNLASKWGITPADADETGMLGTGLNVSLITAMLRSIGVPAQAFSRGPCLGYGTPYNRAAVRRALDTGCVTLLAGGMGVSGISTDVAAVHSAADSGAEAVVMSKFGTDGVYSADPRCDPTARHLPTLTASYALENRLAVMDHSALALAIQHGVTIHVVAANDASATRAVLEGISTGSVIQPA